jgi:hypothetical protein
MIRLGKKWRRSKDWLSGAVGPIWALRSAFQDFSSHLLLNQ